MKLFVLLSILFSLRSFAWFDPNGYIPNFECTKESLNQDIAKYIRYSFELAIKNMDEDPEWLRSMTGVKDPSKVLGNPELEAKVRSHISSEEEEDQINYKAHLAYIKQCDNFTDFVNEQELGHPDILGKQKLFAVEKNLLYILRVVTKEKDIKTLKKLINQGLDIDVLFELTERRGLPYMDDSPPSYNIYGWMDVNKEDSKEEALAKNAFQRLLIELGSKGRDVDYRSI